MRPPDCYVCHLTLHEVPDDGRDYFALVTFGATEDAKMAPSRALEAAGRTGHAYNRIWFCNEHLPLGREHADRDLNEALDAIKADPRYRVTRKAGPKAGLGRAQTTVFTRCPVRRWLRWPGPWMSRHRGDAMRISRRFPRVPAQGSIDNARGVARPLPGRAGKRRWAGGEPGRRVHGWLGGC